MKNFDVTVPILDRVISVFSYLTAGWGGLICLVVMYFAHITPSKFLRFNVCQSIFISFGVFVIGMIYNLLFGILTHIPILQILFSWIDLLLNKPAFGQYSLLQAIILLYLCYVVIFSIFGHYPKIYKISELFYRI